MIKVEELTTGTYFTKHGVANYRVSPDFHNCTYSLLDLDENPNTRHSFHFLSWAEVEEMADSAGYQITEVR